MDEQRPHCLSVSENNLFASFSKVSSGSERASYDKLKADNPGSFFFKALGSFDIVSLRETISFSGDHPTNKPPEITSSQNVVASKFDCELFDPFTLNDWLNDALIVGFSFLELDKYLYSLSSPFKVCTRIIKLIHESGKWGRDSFSFFIGYGQSEIIILQKASNFDDLFEFTNFTRGLLYKKLFPDMEDKDWSNFPILASTFTVPLISYENVIIPKKYDELSGDINVDIGIQCPPGKEEDILEEKFFSSQVCMSTLGNTDVLVHFNKKIATSILIEKLLLVREKWSPLSPQLIDTNTSISFPINENKSIADMYLIDYDQIPKYPLLSKIAPDFEKYRPETACRIKELINKIESYIHIRKFYPAVSSMMHFPLRILGEVEEYIDYLRLGNDPTYPFDGSLSLLIENTEKSLAQKTETNFSGGTVSYTTPSSFGDGVLSQVLAIETLVSFIYKCISKSITKNDMEWGGYTFFDNSGFQHYVGDVFSLPYEAVSSVLCEKVNWLTLTHEISHAIFTILDVDTTHKNEIIEIYQRLSGDHSKDPDTSLYRRVRDEVYELFANWFDYYHFYHEEHDFYQKCIWQSWDAIPYVNKEKVEYISRSFAIFALQDMESYRSHIISGKDVKFIEEKWASYIDFLKINHMNILKKYTPESVATDIKTNALYYFLPLSSIILDSKYDEFREIVNQPYHELEGHIKNLFFGKVIEGSISNPYLLIKECMKIAQEKKDTETHMAGIAIIFSLKNSCRFFEN